MPTRSHSTDTRANHSVILPCNRRQFLRFTSATAAAGGIWQAAARLALSADALDAADVVTGKNSRLIVHSSKPVEIGTPLSLLRDHTVTPKSLLFVRNNQALDGTLTIAPAEDRNWKIELGGLVEFPRTIKVSDLERMEQVEHELVLQCSGNGRALFSQAAAAAGSQWQHGAMGNVRFKGVPLKSVVDRLKPHISSKAKFVTAEGKDSPIKPGAADFEHSIPLDEALEKSFLALQLNGEPIPRIHGGPVRLITPGYYGTMNIKWLSRLRFEARETANHHQIKRYRTPRKPIVPGSEFDYSADNSEPNWGMRIKSVIFSPLEGQQVEAGNVAVEGVAWNDGTAKITAVEVSTNGGRRWQQADVKIPDSPYAWHHWSAQVRLPRGDHSIAARAVDALGRTQPIDGAIHWNPAGYAWNGVHQIHVTVG